MLNEQYFEHGGILFKIWLNADGYPCVTWGRGRNRRPFLLHRLVYELAFGVIPEGHQIHHLDGDRANWAPDNLQAVTPWVHRAIHFPGRCAVLEAAG